MTAALGPLRALDAFRLETLPKARAAGLARRHAARLAKATVAARSDALAAAQAVLGGDAMTDFGAQLALLPAVQAPASAISPKLATSLLGRLHRRMLRLGKGFAAADIEARHNLRLAGKGFVELAALIETDVPLRQRAIRRATRLTAAIGSARDREQALAIVEGLVEPAASTALAEALAGIAGVDDRRLKRRWRAFRRAPPPRPKHP
jgi:CHAD domain-containing protein